MTIKLSFNNSENFVFNKREPSIPLGRCEAQVIKTLQKWSKRRITLSVNKKGDGICIDYVNPKVGK